MNEVEILLSMSVIALFFVVSLCHVFTYEVYFSRSTNVEVV